MLRNNFITLHYGKLYLTFRILIITHFLFCFSFLHYKRVLAKAQHKYVNKKKSRLSPDPVERTVGKIEASGWRSILTLNYNKKITNDDKNTWIILCVVVGINTTSTTCWGYGEQRDRRRRCPVMLTLNCLPSPTWPYRKCGGRRATNYTELWLGYVFFFFSFFLFSYITKPLAPI